MPRHPGLLPYPATCAAQSGHQQLADDPAFTRLGRLKASVDLAQVENCRVSAGLVADDGTIGRALRRVRRAERTEGGWSSTPTPNRVSGQAADKHAQCKVSGQVVGPPVNAVNTSESRPRARHSPLHC